MDAYFCPNSRIFASINSIRHFIVYQCLEMIQSHRNQIKSLLIVANCFVCFRIASVMLHVITIWSEIIANRLKLHWSSPNRPKLVFQASESSLQLASIVTNDAKNLPLVSRYPKEAIMSRKTVSKTPATIPKGILSN